MYKKGKECKANIGKKKIQKRLTHQHLLCPALFAVVSKVVEECSKREQEIKELEQELMEKNAAVTAFKQRMSQVHHTVLSRTWRLGEMHSGLQW